MVDVVPSDHADHALDRLFAAFGVLPELFPLFGRQGFEKRKICLAQDAMELKRLGRVALFVVTRCYPRVLIVGLNRRPRISKNRTHAPADDDLYICKMSKNF